MKEQLCKRCEINKANEVTKVCDDCYEDMHPGIHEEMKEERKLWKIIAEQSAK